MERILTMIDSLFINGIIFILWSQNSTENFFQYITNLNYQNYIFIIMHQILSCSFFKCKLLANNPFENLEKWNQIIFNKKFCFHGKPVGVTWTHTAASGSNTISFKKIVVDWRIGSEIIIDTTVDKFSPGESEKTVIVVKSHDILFTFIEMEICSSFIRECAIHQSFNRAVNIHAKINYVERILFIIKWAVLTSWRMVSKLETHSDIILDTSRLFFIRLPPVYWMRMWPQVRFGFRAVG